MEIGSKEEEKLYINSSQYTIFKNSGFKIALPYISKVVHYTYTSVRFSRSAYVYVSACTDNVFTFRNWCIPITLIWCTMNIFCIAVGGVCIIYSLLHSQ